MQPTKSRRQSFANARGTAASPCDREHRIKSRHSKLNSFNATLRFTLTKSKLFTKTCVAVCAVKVVHCFLRAACLVGREAARAKHFLSYACLRWNCERTANRVVSQDTTHRRLCGGLGRFFRGLRVSRSEVFALTFASQRG